MYAGGQRMCVGLFAEDINSPRSIVFMKVLHRKNWLPCAIFSRNSALQLGGGDEPSAKDYARTLIKIKDRPDAQLLQTVMLRSLRQAVYSPDNVGHFGLAYESYTHFTSPIRRYPDLLVHRAIKAVLNGTMYSPGDWHELGDALLTDRAPRGRCQPRCGVMAQMLLHAG